jgi:hypothetical protein
MKEIKFDKEIHGDLLAQELGIDKYDLWVCGETLQFRNDIEEDLLKNVLSKHKAPAQKDPTALKASALAKLAALGLTEDEIAAL